MSRVTAIVVVRNGERQLPTTLDALATQTRLPDALVIVDCASRDQSLQIAQAVGPTQLIRSESRLSFGDAIELAVQRLGAHGPDDALWLLPHDAAPEPPALAALLAELEVSPSVVVAGPKLMRADNPDYLVEYGESITNSGATVTLVHDELDQGQHDGLSDVLAVSPAGMLVRHQVWTELGGFDPGLPVVDNALDFCIRARLAGHRVSVTPQARVLFGGGGIAGGSESEKWRQRIVRARQSRTAQLHRRMAYAPGIMVPLHWLSWLPLALVRAAYQLLMQAPGQIGGEFRAAFAVFFGLGSVAASRRMRTRSQTRKWAIIEPLRVHPAEMRRRRALEREARLARVTGERNEIRFFASGGGWVLAVAVAVSAIIFLRLIPASALVGGGLGLLSDSVGALWQNAAYGWRDLSTGFVGAADPFILVLASLGTFTFWAPSYAMVLLWLVAIPAAAMTAWFTAARFTQRGGIRAMAAFLWAFAPMLLAALADGRPGAVIAHILLPLLMLAMLGASRSWSAAAAAGLLFAAVAASAPSLIPALVIGWLVLLIAAGRGTAKVFSVPFVTLVLFAPIAVTQFVRGTPLGLLADPGFPVSGSHSTSTQLLVGFPTSTGWDGVLSGLGVGWLDWLAPELLTSVLVLPLLVMALVGLFAPGSRIALSALVLALAGLATALMAQQIQVATAGAERVFLWSGSGLSIYWLGLAGAAVIGMRALGKWGRPVTVLATIALVALSTPLAVNMVRGEIAAQPAPERNLPAYVAAQSASTPRLTTLQLTPQPSGGIRALLQRNLGATLDQQSTLAQTSLTVSDSQQQLAELSGNLVSTSGKPAMSDLQQLGIQFVLLSPATDATAVTDALTQRARIGLSQKTELVEIGETAYGTLWRVDQQVQAQPIPAGAGGWVGTLVLILQLLVLGATVLMALPAGVGRETKPQRVRRGSYVLTPPLAAAAATNAPEPERAPISEPELQPEPQAEADASTPSVEVSDEPQ